MLAGGYGDGEHLPQARERVDILSHNWFLYPVWPVLFHPCEHSYRIVQVPSLKSVEIDSIMLPEGFAEGPDQHHVLFNSPITVRWPIGEKPFLSLVTFRL